MSTNLECTLGGASCTSVRHGDVNAHNMIKTVRGTQYKVTKESVDGEYRACLYRQTSEGWKFVRDIDLHSQMSYAEARETLLQPHALVGGFGF